MPIETTGFWAAAVLAAVLVGLSKGGWPVVGMLAVPIMSLVMNPLVAAGLLLPVYIVSDIFGVWAYRREFHRKLLMLLVPAGLLGTLIGWATASIVSERAVTGVVGAIGLAFALNRLLRNGDGAEPRPIRVGPGIFWGTLTGFTSFISHAGAPPYQVFVLPLKLSKQVFAGTTTILFAIINASKLVPYWQLGQLNVGSVKAAALLLGPAVLGVFAGHRLVKVVPTKTFYAIVTWALLLVSVRLLWVAALG